ncbi:MAG: tRNA 2-selenouridine(34) synthase MnmH, partial [Pseudomonadota bacterium]
TKAAPSLRALVARNAARHLEEALAEKDGGWRPLVYCWRGGQRSGSFASILQQIGWRAETLAGGYQSYRRLVVRALYERAFPAPVVVLDGNTGTAKTRLLALLKARGLQVIDLEAIAQHRGSALGAYQGQPSQKGFETALAAEVAALDPEMPVVVEAESSRVGVLNLPPVLWKAMRAAPRVEISAPVEARVAFLVEAYADMCADPQALCARLQLLVPRQGRARVDDWCALAQAGAFAELARELIIQHYDPGYAKLRALVEVPRQVVCTETLDAAGLGALADDIAARLMRGGGKLFE